MTFVTTAVNKTNMAGHDGYTRYTTRIPNDLYERIKLAAGEKSVNAEIVEALEALYPAPSPKKAFLDSLKEAAAFLTTLDPDERAEMRKEIDKALMVNAYQQRKKHPKEEDLLWFEQLDPED